MSIAAAGARVLLLGSLTTLVAACGEEAPASTPTSTPAAAVSTDQDGDRAQEMLLRLADFSGDWEEDAAPDPGEGPFGECPSLRRVESTAAADSPAFTDGLVALRHSVFMFESPEVARSHMDVTRERMECIAGLFNSGAMDTSEERFSDARYDEVPFSRVIGDQVIALRLGTLLRAGDEQALISADIVTFRVGRSLHTLQSSLSAAPLRTGNMAEYGVIVAERAAAVLGEVAQ